jgi:hypothetical protein
MPVVSGEATREKRPIIVLLARATEARAEALEEQRQAPEMRAVNALIDTGASDTYIERSLADDLDLDPVGEVDVHGVTAGGKPEKGIVFRVRLLHAGVPAVELIPSARVIAVNDLSRFDSQILLGRDLLARGILVYDGPQGRFTFAF